MAEKILVVVLHGIGDSLMAQPGLHALKKKYPDSTLTVMTIKNSAFKDLWSTDDVVDEVLFSSLEHNPSYGNPLFWIGDYWTIQHDIRRAVKTHGFTHVYFVKMFLMPAKIYSFLHLPRYEKHKTLKVARELDVTLYDQHYHLTYRDDDRRWAETFLSERKLDSDVLIGIHTSGSHPSKSLPAEAVQQLVETLRSLGYQVLAFHSAASYERDKNSLPSDVPVCMSDSLLHTAAVVDRCKALICIDSGISHLAAALNKKVFSIYFKDVWMKNSLALGEHVTPCLYSKDIPALLEQLQLFLQ